MGTDSIEVTAVIPASAASVYAAWLDSEGHTAMTGGDAVIDAVVGGAHSAWGGYITGETRALEAGRRIEQTWRALDFPEGSGHSLLVVTIEDEDEGARVTIAHSELPEGMGASYQIGWQDHYFTPMMAYFETGGATPKKKAPAKKAAAKKAAAKKAPAKKAVAKKAVAKKAVAKKAVAKKAVAKKAVAKKAVAKKAPAKKAPAKKAPAKKAVAKKAPAKKAPAKKAVAKKAAKKAAKKRS
jgi:uncharacterized protein YndB with AHSA1/START domain